MMRIQELRTTLPYACTSGCLPAAGVASLVAVWLRNRLPSSERLRCYAFEAPACMDLRLAQACAGACAALEGVVGAGAVAACCLAGQPASQPAS